MKKTINPYIKKFLHRGLLFGGFGPIIVGIVYMILSYTLQDFSLTGTQIALAIVSSYLLAFIQAGASVFNQIEKWSVGRSLLCHFACLYIAYVGCYLLNSWIPFDWSVVLIFTAIFTVSYAIIWLTVFLSVKALCRRFNRNLHA